MKSQEEVSSEAEEGAVFEKDSFESMVVNQPIDLEFIKKEVGPKYAGLMEYLQTRIRDDPTNTNLLNFLAAEKPDHFDVSLNSKEFGNILKDHIEFLRNEFSQRLQYLD